MSLPTGSVYFAHDPDVARSAIGVRDISANALNVRKKLGAVPSAFETTGWDGRKAAIFGPLVVQRRDKTKMLNEGIEVAVAIEQLETAFDAACRDHGVDGFTHRHTKRS